MRDIIKMTKYKENPAAALKKSQGCVGGGSGGREEKSTQITKILEKTDQTQGKTSFLKPPTEFVDLRLWPFHNFSFIFCCIYCCITNKSVLPGNLVTHRKDFWV